MEDIIDLLTLAEAFSKELPPSPAALVPPTGPDIASWIDHTLLKPQATASQIKELCQEAIQYKFAAVCVNPVYVSLASGLLKDSPVSVCVVVGFPLGATTPTIKIAETLSCLNSGAAEIDMVMNIGALKGEAYGQVLNDIQAVVQTAHNQRAIVKVILETALLTQREKIIACLLSKAAGADFVKTSTGFGPGGATVEDVDLMYRVVGSELKVKAAGGIRTLADAQAMIRAGASRIGASAGVNIVHEANP
jgi:deoxyribose-phosphate aldolase